MQCRCMLQPGTAVPMAIAISGVVATSGVGAAKKRSKHKTQASICKPLLALFMPFSLSEL